MAANVAKANGSLDGHVNEIGREQVKPLVVEDDTGQTDVELIIEDIELDKLPKRRKKRCKGK